MRAEFSKENTSQAPWVIQTDFHLLFIGIRTFYGLIAYDYFVI